MRDPNAYYIRAEHKETGVSRMIRVNGGLNTSLWQTTNHGVAYARAVKFGNINEDWRYTVEKGDGGSVVSEQDYTDMIDSDYDEKNERVTGPGEMPDIVNEYWVAWVDRESGEVGSTIHTSADEAHDYANTINDQPGTKFRAYVVSKV